MTIFDRATLSNATKHGFVKNENQKTQNFQKQSVHSGLWFCLRSLCLISSVPFLYFLKNAKIKIRATINDSVIWGGPKRTVLTSERVAKLNGPKTQEKKKVVSRPTRAPVVSSCNIGFRFFLCENHSCIVVFATCVFLRFRRSTPA